MLKKEEKDIPNSTSSMYTRLYTGFVEEYFFSSPYLKIPGHLCVGGGGAGWQVLGVAQECCWRFDQMDYTPRHQRSGKREREAQSWVESSLIPDKMGRSRRT